MVDIMVVESETLSKKYDKRYIIVNKESGELLDDAQGYGYKTPQKAHAAWAYKTRDRTKDKERIVRNRQIKQWLKEHECFCDVLEETSFACAVDGEPFDTKVVSSIIRDMKIEVDFKPYEILKVWRNLK